MRILYYIYALNIGGAETFIYSVLNRIDTERYHIDFALQSLNNENKVLLNLCQKKKLKIYYIPSFYKSPINNIRNVEKWRKRNKKNCIIFC